MVGACMEGGKGTGYVPDAPSLHRPVPIDDDRLRLASVYLGTSWLKASAW